MKQRKQDVQPAPQPVDHDNKPTTSTKEGSKVIDREKREEKEDILVAYQSLLERHPLLINALQSAVLAGLGVIISQLISVGQVVDELEIRVMMLLNVVFHTPVLYVFYTHILSRISHLGMLLTLAVDQLLFSPIFTAGVILRLWMRGSAWESIPQELRVVIPQVLVSSWSFWIPARFLILKYVPLPFQLLSGSLVALVWNVIFAMILNP